MLHNLLLIVKGKVIKACRQVVLAPFHKDIISLLCHIFHIRIRFYEYISLWFIG